MRENTRIWYEVLSADYEVDEYTTLVCFGKFTKKEVEALESTGIYRLERHSPSVGDLWYSPQGCLMCGTAPSFRYPAVRVEEGYLCAGCREKINKR